MVKERRLKALDVNCHTNKDSDAFRSVDGLTLRVVKYIRVCVERVEYDSMGRIL
jgi:hypothetical protein